MRRIICRFEDDTEFLRHLQRPPLSSDEPPSLSFLARFGLKIGEVVRVSIIIADPGERHDLHMRVADRHPTLHRADGNTRFSYRATATEGDAPWLEMLAQKFDTARRMSA